MREKRQKVTIWRKSVSWFMTLLLTTSATLPSFSQSVLNMPAPGTMVTLSQPFAPPMLKGLKVYNKDPFRFDFILDKGDATVNDEQLKLESNRLIKYFLASLTVPEKDLWVNLSPYEKGRIAPEAFGQTEMGRDLLAQDYLLKQITASVIYPEEKVGKDFWDKVYAEAQKRYGTIDVPIDTFNKVWIVPEQATVYEKRLASAGQATAFVVESKLKVMLESDYLALSKSSQLRKAGTTENAPPDGSQEMAKQIIREIVIPILEKEVNEGKNFETLRQVYNSLILATWYKRKVKESIMGRGYVDRKKTAGIDIADQLNKEKIWEQYVEAFKKGAYNFIKEEYDPATQSTIPRKYFSGGTSLQMDVFRTVDFAMLPQNKPGEKVIVQARVAESATSGKKKEGGTEKGVANATKPGDQAMSEVSNDLKKREPPILEETLTYQYLPESHDWRIWFGADPEGNPISISISDIAAPENEAIWARFRTLMAQHLDEGIAKQITSVLSHITPNALDAVFAQYDLLIKNGQGDFEHKVSLPLKVFRSEGFVTIAVEDSGIGIAHEVLEGWSKGTFQSYGKDDGGFSGSHGRGTAIVLNNLAKMGARVTYSTFNKGEHWIFTQEATGQRTLEKGSSTRPGTVVEITVPFKASEGLKKSETGTRDAAQIETPGGIDLNPDRVELNTQSSGGEIKFDIDPAILQRVQAAPGVTPVIINLLPLNDLRQFLGAQ